MHRLILLTFGIVLLLIVCLTIWPRSKYAMKFWFISAVELDDEDFDYLLNDDQTSINITSSRSTYQDYFSYGLNHSSLTRINSTGYEDYIYGPFHVPIKFTAHNQSFTSFNIFVDGYVTFTNSHGYLSVCPFYSDIDTSRKGAIYHGEFRDENMLKSIGDDVRNLCKYDSFVPIWAYVVTWFECRPSYIRDHDVYFGANSDYSNTFQLIMTSNGLQSFAFFNFVRLDWPNDVIESSFSSSYYYSFFESFHYSNGESIFEDQSLRNLTEKSNMGRPGRWFISFNNTDCDYPVN